MNKITKTEPEWRAQLDDIQYQVTRKHATEPAWSGKYATNKDSGIYNCVCCGEALFDSVTKYGLSIYGCRDNVNYSTRGSNVFNRWANDVFLWWRVYGYPY